LDLDLATADACIRLALALVVLHYLKREVETVFVHRFSNGTMPLFNIFKNSTHYWYVSLTLRRRDCC
jgi:hypothetical protein